MSEDWRRRYLSRASTLFMDFAGIDFKYMDATPFFFESSNWRACSVFNFSAVIVCFYEKVYGAKFGRALPKFEAILILSLPWLIFFLAFAFP